MMKILRTLAMVLLLAAALAGCRSTPARTPAAPSEPPPEEETPENAPEEGHGPVREARMAEGYGEGGYCGNTVTKITAGEETYSIWGDDSVGLTDLLLYLDYQDGICRCLPEYSVETEFGEESYGVNLTEAYVRYGERQCPLTAEQAEYIRGVIEEACVPEHAE